MGLTDEDKQWIRQQLEHVGTTLLKEFHKSASPLEARLRTHAATLCALDIEMEQVDERVNKLEGRN